MTNNDNQKYDLKLLWEATSDGLDYFHKVFPESVGKENTNKHFSALGDNDSHTILTNKTEDGTYKIHNFRTGESVYTIKLCQLQNNNCDWLEAVKILFALFGLAENESKLLLPEKTFKETTKELGFFDVNYKKSIEKIELIAPFATLAIGKDYGLKSIESYQRTYTNKETQKVNLITVTATEEYPIFAWTDPEAKDFVKIYEPKAIKNKLGFSSKHSFLGKLPERHIYGWKRLFSLVDLSEIKRIYQLIAVESDWTEKEKLQRLVDTLKLDEIFIATGGSDGINIASLGYKVMWFNSETQIINRNEFYQLQQIAKTIYYVSDNDKTGVEQAVKMGLQHLDLKIVWMPESLKLRNKKDAADLIRILALETKQNLPIVCNKFKQIVSQSMPFKFWSFDKKRGVYVLELDFVIHFLKHNGFFLNKTLVEKAGEKTEITSIVLIKNNVVKVVTPRQVRNYLLQWLEENFIDRGVKTMIMKSIYFSMEKLLLLPEIELKEITRTGTVNSQMYFFKNKVAKITPESVVLLDNKQIDVMSWEDEIIKTNITLQPIPFKVYKDESKNWRCEPINTNSNYFKVLINTSRIFWRKDADENQIDLKENQINSNNLTDKENRLQELHLLNKFYVVGYFLHRYKISSNALFVLGMDNKIGATTTESNGRSGKSFIIEILRNFLFNWKQKSGKGLKNENQQFIYDGVTDKTSMVFYDDLQQYQDLTDFFDRTTGDFEANHKGGAIFNIPFKFSPKLGGTTNFAPTDLSDSLQGRLLAYYASDFYHQATSINDHAFTRKIAIHNNGKDLLKDETTYTASQFNDDYNFMLYCIQFYLQQPEKIDAPMEGLIIKSLRQKIGNAMIEFCDKIFIEKDEFGALIYFDKYIYKKGLHDAYKEEIGGKAKSSQEFLKNLKLYCITKNWEIKVEKQKHDGKSVDHFFLSDLNKKNNNVANGENIENTIIEDTEPEIDF